MKINLKMLKVNQALIINYYINLYDNPRDEYIKDMTTIFSNIVLKKNLEDIKYPKTEIQAWIVKCFWEIIDFIRFNKFGKYKKEEIYFYNLLDTIEKIYDEVSINPDVEVSFF